MKIYPNNGSIRFRLYCMRIILKIDLTPKGPKYARRAYSDVTEQKQGTKLKNQPYLDTFFWNFSVNFVPVKINGIHF